MKFIIFFFSNKILDPHPTRIYDTSSNDTSFTTTLRLKFSSNGHFVETSLRRTQLCRMRHLVEIFPLFRMPKLIMA